jgi:GTP-binding protein EngB required for normal cell division
MDGEDAINIVVENLVTQVELKTKAQKDYWALDTKHDKLEILNKNNYDAFIKERAVKENLVSEIESLINVVCAGMNVDDLKEQLRNMIGAK